MFIEIRKCNLITLVVYFRRSLKHVIRIAVELYLIVPFIQQRCFLEIAVHEHLSHCLDPADVPIRDVLVEQCPREHSIHITDVTDVPLADVLVKC